MLQRLRDSLHILQHREAKYGIDAPASLKLEITDHETAIGLTKQLAADHLTESVWREQLQPLLVSIEKRQATEAITALKIGGVSFSQISGSSITTGDIEANIQADGDVVGGDKMSQNVEGRHNAQATHGGHAEVNTSSFDQRGQQVSGDQYNAAGDIHIHGQSAPTPTQRGGYAVVGALLAVLASIAVNLLSSGLEEEFFSDGFAIQSLWGLGLFAVVGALLGLWLSGPVTVPASAASSTQSSPSGTRSRVTITRLRALLSYTKLRGKGIHLSDILLIGSRIDIDVEE